MLVGIAVAFELLSNLRKCRAAPWMMDSYPVLTISNWSLLQASRKEYRINFALLSARQRGRVAFHRVQASREHLDFPSDDLFRATVIQIW